MARKPSPQAEPDFNGADPAAFDHDGDGQPGGSKKRTIGKLELEAIGREAYEAYDFQQERLRYDSLGRKWLFRVEVKPPGESVLMLSVGDRSDTISTALLPTDIGPALCGEVVAALDEAGR